MKRLLLSAVFFAICAIVSFAVVIDIATVYPWTVEMTSTKTFDIPAWHHGETVVFEATYVQKGVPKDFTAAHLVEFWYRPASCPKGSPYSVITGEVYSATSGVIRARWDSSREFTNCNDYVYQFVVQSTTAQVMPGGGRFSLLGSLSDGGAPRTNPRTLEPFDCALYDFINIGLSPFLSSFQIDDLQSELDTLFDGTGDAHVHDIVTEVPPALSATNMFDFPDYLARTGDLVPDTVTNVVKGEEEAVFRVERIDEHNVVLHPAITAEGEVQTTNRLYWIVDGQAIGYISSNGITMLKGSLQLYEEDLNCNVRAYDGARTAPSVTFYASPGIGWYRKSISGSYAWAFAHNSNDVLTHGANVELEWVQAGAGSSGNLGWLTPTEEFSVITTFTNLVVGTNIINWRVTGVPYPRSQIKLAMQSVSDPIVWAATGVLSSQ
jgi:hypothetical protein